ncbi:hypothetical protein MKX01_002106 [Papaver californicum]|nr:hypothetical protein MKX01_002106 [Papaver californicum]
MIKGCQRIILTRYFYNISTTYFLFYFFVFHKLISFWTLHTISNERLTHSNLYGCKSMLLLHMEVVGGGFPRPLLDLSANYFSKVMDSAFVFAFVPPFDPYANELNYFLATYLVPYVGLIGYVGSSHLFKGDRSKKLAAGLLAVESAQDAVVEHICTRIYKRQRVRPYGITVAEFMSKIPQLRDKLGGDGLKDEGIVVPPAMGAEGKISGNVIDCWE